VALSTAGVVRIGTVVINTTDVEALSRFWSELLGVEEAYRLAGFVWLKPQRPGAFQIAFQLVEDPTPGRRRLHLDSAVDDVETATARILELGGSHVEDHEIAGFAWRVMADPDGNEFCIAAGGD
jgi:catechol 2,3-dioxygenase-like lactoylglutathione lyase family enzyme